MSDGKSDEARERRADGEEKGSKAAGKAAKLAATGAAIAMAGSIGSGKPGLLAELEDALATLTVREAYAAEEGDRVRAKPGARIAPRAPSVLERTMSTGEKLRIQTQIQAGEMWPEVTWVQSGWTQDIALPKGISQAQRERAVQKVLEDVRKEMASEQAPEGAPEASRVVERTTRFGDTVKIQTRGVGRDTWAQDMWNRSSWVQDIDRADLERQREIQRILDEVRKSGPSPDLQAPDAPKQLR